ncbi:hypothetical protein CVV68_18015 [Arthrobacter livingstonensis]|uniref:Uncharacterized protein n=1 Tax=Arthrobacter livingstonensis TaxID=670078 RepID=A0A2V5L2Z3_9MICC|nr:hypothetical protein CVV68_18015 [Arthrobacter livingstonensis]
MAQSLYSNTFGSVLPTTAATTADSTTNANIAAEAPLNFLERAQTTTAPSSGAMLPLTYAVTSFPLMPLARWKSPMPPPTSSTVTAMLKATPFFAGCSLNARAIPS